MNTAVCQLIPFTRFLSVTSYIPPQNPRCSGPELPGQLSVTFMPHGWKISSINLILQVAMLAVSATTHKYVLIDNRSLKTICGPTHRALSCRTKIQLTDS